MGRLWDAQEELRFVIEELTALGERIEAMRAELVGIGEATNPETALRRLALEAAIAGSEAQAEQLQTKYAVARAALSDIERERAELRRQVEDVVHHYGPFFPVLDALQEAINRYLERETMPDYVAAGMAGPMQTPAGRVRQGVGQWAEELAAARRALPDLQARLAEFEGE